MTERNPLDSSGEDAETGFHQRFSGMMPGETRTVMVATAMLGNGRPDPESRRPLTITRTKRPFIHDWVDARNEQLRLEGHALRWVFQGRNPEPRLMDPKHLPQNMASQGQML